MRRFAARTRSWRCGVHVRVIGKSRAQTGSAAAGRTGEQDGVQYPQGSLHSSIRPISSPQRSTKKR